MASSFTERSQGRERDAQGPDAGERSRILTQAGDVRRGRWPQASVTPGSSAMSWTSRRPIRPEAPCNPDAEPVLSERDATQLTSFLVSSQSISHLLSAMPVAGSHGDWCKTRPASRRFGLGVQGDRPDDIIEIVGHDHRPVGEPARRTPRLPSTFSKLSWSVPW